MNPAEFQELVAGNAAFANFSEAQFAEFTALISGIRTCQPEEFLIRQGDSATQMFVIVQGHVEILTEDAVSGAVHPVATLGVGECVGEMALLDSGTRLASARAIDRVEVAVVELSELQLPKLAEIGAQDALKVQLAKTVALRTRDSNQETARNLESILSEAERRIEMSKFMSRVLVGVCLYTFAVGAILGFGGSLESNQIAVIPILGVFVIALYLNIRTSIYPASDYGFNLHSWQAALVEGTALSLIFIATILLCKWLGIHHLGLWEGHDLIEPSAPSSQLLMMVVGYILFTLIQEVIARSGMQSSFALFLTGPAKTAIAVILAALLMSSTYMLISLSLAVLVFPFAIALGWLYSRRPTLLGVCWAHVLVGSSLHFVIGLPF